MLMALILAVAMGMRPDRAWGQEPPPDPTPAAEGTDPQDGQILTRGPVHEAFAAPVVHDPKATPAVPKEPPAPIQEMPPDQKPAGQNVQWIPGYWAWDDSRNDFLWVSGIWREPPPNSQWVPGYWNQVDEGFQWVPGTWIPVSSGPAQGPGQARGQSQATYLPPPPPSLEAGPNLPQPSPSVAWTPGYWSWQATGYVWRPGFWAAIQPNWIWVPPHYVWTPSGYLFVAGYWDLPVANRGLLFAPVYYPQPVYARPGFSFTPSISIVGSAVTANLFVQANTNQYLFGDFYAQNYVSVGIVPWFSFTFASGRPAYYDPLFSYYAVVNVQQNPAWVTQVRREYVLRRENLALRPPRTYVEQTRLIERNVNVTRNVNITRNVTVVDHRTLAMPLNKLASDAVAGRGLRLERVSPAERQQLRQQVAQLHEFRAQRLNQERETARGGVAARPRTMSLPHSPIAAHHPAARAGHEGLHGAGQAGGTASHPSVAHRPEMAREPSRQVAPGRGRSRVGEAPPHQAWPERSRPGAGAAARWTAPDGAEVRHQPRAGMTRPGSQDPRRPDARERERSRSAEEEERRRRPGS
jgi:hypothetical protein